MHNLSLQQQINQLYDNIAATYDAEPGHGIGDEEYELWQREIDDAVAVAAGNRVLDVGSGTGILSQIFAQWGCSVVGVDSSLEMVAQAQTKQAPTTVTPITYVVGDTHAAELFDDRTFDLIVSRQVVCHFRDPLAVFQNWRRWLKAGGQVIVIDGLWFRAGWDDVLVDQLPLSCLQTRATVAYLLEKAGFQIIHNNWLTRVNTYLQSVDPTASPRYMVVAREK